MNVGDYTLEDNVTIPFTTRAFATGIPTVLTSGTVEIYEDDSATQITTAETLSTPDSIAGFNMLLVAATAANGFEAGKSYTAVITVGTVGGVSVVGEVVGHFTIERAWNEADVVSFGGGAIPTPAVTGVPDVNVTHFVDGAAPAPAATGVPDVNTTHWIDGAIPAQSVTGVPEVDVTHFVGGIAPAPFTTGIPDVNVAEILDTAPSLTGGDLDVNVAAMAANTITASAVAVDAFDTDAFTTAAKRQLGNQLIAGTASGAGSTTTLVDSSLTETDDIWTGNWIRFTAGTPDIVNQVRLITNFVAASDTLTFAPAVKAATDATTQFEIIGYGGADVQSWLGLETAMAAPNALVGGAVDADVSAIQANAITAAAIATDAIDADAIAANAIGASELATDAIGDAQIATGAIASTAFAAGAIDAAAIATAAIDADAIAADAITAAKVADGTIDAATFAAGAIDATAIAAGALDTDAFTAGASRQLGGLLFSGTADAGGSSTTIDDAALTEADDIWTGGWVLITSGTSANQCRLITNFDSATDVLTFAPAVSSAIGAGVTYEIYANAGVDVQSWLGTLAAMQAPNALVAGAVDADVSAMQAGVITAAAIATDAIDDDAIATGAIASTAFAAGAIDASAIAADAIGASEIANGAIDAATFAAGAINAAALATDAVDEIADGVWDEDVVAAHATADTAGLIISELTKRSITFSTAVVDGSALGQVADDGTAVFDRTTDSLQAIRDRGDTDWTTGSGTGLTALASGTAQSGAAGTIQLAAAETFANDELNGTVVNLVGGTGVGQSRVIIDYVSSTDTATVTPNWTTNPSSDTLYEIVNGSVNITAVSNAAEDVSTATALAAVQSDTDDIQTRLPAALVGGRMDSDVAVIQANVVNASALATDAVDEIADGVWNEDATGHQTLGTFGQAIGDPGTDATTIYQAVATDAAGDNVSIDVAAVKAETALIVADTNELQTDDVPGLIAALNDIAAGDVWAVDATTQQTQGTFGQAIGDPVADATTIYQSVATDAAGDNVSVDVAAVKAETALIVADTNELQTDDVPGLIAALNDISTAEVNTEVDNSMVTYGLDHLVFTSVIGTDVADDSIIAQLVSSTATADWDDFDNTTDSLEAIRARGDAAWTTGAGGSDRLLMVDTTIATLASQTEFTLTAGSADNDAYNNCTIVIEDASTATQKAVGVIIDYVGSTKTVTLLEDPLAGFTMATTDKVYILAENALKTTTANRQLNVAADGDLVEVNTLTGHTAQTGDNFARLGSPAGASVSVDIAALQSDTDNIQTRLPGALVGGLMDSNVGAISADTVAADNLELDYDGTGYAKANSTIGTTTTNTDMRGTDSAALASVATEARLAELDAANLPADVDAILLDTGTTIPAQITGLNDIAAGDVWAVDATTQQTAGTFGQAIGDPAANAETIYDAVVTDAAGLNVSVDVAAVKAETALIVADTNELQGDWVNGGRLDNILDARASQVTADAIETDTQDIQSRLPAVLIAGRMDSDMSAISTSTAAADGLEASSEIIIIGAAQAGTLSTTQMTTNLTEVTTDHYVGRVIIWTSGPLLGQATDITAYNGTGGLLTFTATTEAPIAGNTFVML